MPLTGCHVFVCFVFADANRYGSSNGTKCVTEWSVSTPHSQPIQGDKPTGDSYGAEGKNHMKVVILGAPGVGKTAIAQVRPCREPVLHTKGTRIFFYCTPCKFFYNTPCNFFYCTAWIFFYSLHTVEKPPLHTRPKLLQNAHHVKSSTLLHSGRIFYFFNSSLIL